ncbi:MAG: hypothetical protein ACRELD_15450 [Longimicrobiales bacterium]
MKTWDGARWRAAGTAALLLVAGGVMGVVADRVWLRPPQAHGMPLTAEAMSARLGLSSAEAAHVRALLDSLRADFRGVVQQNPDSLQTAVRNAHLRIEAALPPAARPEFRAWMQEHHQQMMDRMHGRPMDHGMMNGRP